MTSCGEFTTDRGQFNPPKWVFKPNIPKKPRLRVRCNAGVDGWTFVISTTERVPVAADFGTYPKDYHYWTDGARQLYALIQARNWLLQKYGEAESLVCMVNVAPAREQRGKAVAA